MTTNDTLQLRSDQIDLLRRAEQLDDPILFDGDAVETLRSLLEPAVERTGVRDPSCLSVEQLAFQLSDDDVDGVDALRQTPEAGDQPADADANANTNDVTDTDSLADRVDDDTLVLLSKAQTHDRNDRLPDYAQQLREDAADRLGVEIDDLERALDHGEIHVPSDPKLLLD